jgi:hypothetical protein
MAETSKQMAKAPLLETRSSRHEKGDEVNYEKQFCSNIYDYPTLKSSHENNKSYIPISNEILF